MNAAKKQMKVSATNVTKCKEIKFNVYKISKLGHYNNRNEKIGVKYYAQQNLSSIGRTYIQR